MSKLGTELKLARIAAGISQEALATQAGVSVPAVRRTERTEGGFESFVKQAEVLGLTVGSRTPLPAANSIGEQLSIYRRRLGRHSVRSLAAAAGVTPETVTAIEAGKIGHLVALDAVASVLGVSLCLERAGRAKSFVGAATSSQHECWTTPGWVLDRLYAVIGGEFCLDPCSPTKDRTRAPVQARRYFTQEDDGLSRPWKGKLVFMNPPYGRVLADWMAKAASEAASGRAELVIGLVPARVDVGWWHDWVVAAGAGVMMFKGRLAFGGEGGTSAPFPCALITWGGDAGHAERLRREFPDSWHIPSQTPLRPLRLVGTEVA